MCLMLNSNGVQIQLENGTDITVAVRSAPVKLRAKVAIIIHTFRSQLPLRDTILTAVEM